MLFFRLQYPPKTFYDISINFARAKWAKIDIVGTFIVPVAFAE
jgi:hypothetical protein